MIKVRSARAGPVFWTFDGFIVIKLLSYISIFWGVSTVSVVKRGTERAGAAALVYHRGSNECCSEGEVEEWLRRRRSGKEERCLILDFHVIRGWEASHLLVVALYGTGLENLVMRAVGYCALVIK